jgi:TM2 domain-containing membrane protein YozV
MSIQPKPKSTERALRLQLAVLFSSFGVEQLQNRCQLDGVCRIFFLLFVEIKSKILLNSFVALFVLLLSFSESNVEISSSFITMETG